MKVEPLADSFQRLPITISMVEAAKFTEVYGFVGRSGRVFLEGQLLRPENPSRTVLLFMHPSSSLSLLPLPRALAEAGFHVMCCGSRYLRNDTALIMEKVALDLAAYIHHARNDLGYEKVVLVGWSGGGSLSIFYQSQAENPRITQTPAGDPVDLAGADLPQADGLLSVAAHLSRAETLTEWLDPSVFDEDRPELRDPVLDIYAADSVHKPPFTAEFVERFRDAQRTRNRRITDRVENMLAALSAQSSGEVERGFLVHRTMCDPRWIDPSVDPNDRKPAWCYLGDPRTANVGPAGLARYTSLRAWMSQWSYDRTNTRTADNAPDITIPALVIENTADDATPAAHPRKIFDLIGSQDKTFLRIEGATHYYQEQPELEAVAVSSIRDWLEQRGLS